MSSSLRFCRFISYLFERQSLFGGSLKIPTAEFLPNVFLMVFLKKKVTLGLFLRAFRTLFFRTVANPVFREVRPGVKESVSPAALALGS